MKVMDHIVPLSIFENRSWWDMTPHAVRDAITARIMSIEAPTRSVYKVEDAKVEEVPIRIYLPSEKRASCAILFIHGGAFVAGNIDTHDNLARFLASKTNCEVVSVGYSLAPEAKFPRAL